MKSSYVRVDMTFDLLSMDEATGKFAVAMRPDPRRCEVTEQNGVKHYRDKYLDLLFSEELLFESAPQLAGLPIFYNPPHIDNTPTYATERRAAVETQLQSGVFVAPDSKTDRHQQLIINEPSRNITFISVDICGSTKLRAENANQFDRAYDIFIQELGTLVGKFHGTFLKTTGDGFIAFIDYPSINTQCDQAIDLGTSLLVVLLDAVNPALVAEGLPEVSIRIGADHGPASITEVSVPTTGFSEPTVKSDALNRAVKIQGEADANQFLIGRTLYERIHVHWLERCREETGIDLALKLGFDEYQIYSVS
jgi:class 3 adenylate cyclase